MLGHAEPDAALEVSDSADRNRHFLTPPQVAFLEEDMSDVVLARVDDQAFDHADLPVGGVDMVAAADSHLTQRDGVVGDGLSGPVDCVALHTRAAAEAGVWPGKNLFWAVGTVGPGSGHELRLFGGVELLKLRHRAAEPDLASAGIDQVKGNETAEPLAALRLNHEMSYGSSDRVHHDATHFATDPIGTSRVGPDRERRRVCHCHPPRPLDPSRNHAPAGADRPSPAGPPRPRDHQREPRKRAPAMRASDTNSRSYDAAF